MAYEDSKAIALKSDEQSKLLQQLRGEYTNGVKYRQGKSKTWKEIEDQYYNRVKMGIKGRFNIPIPVVSGFIDTWLSKVDDAPILRFQPKSEAYYRTNKKVQAFWDQTAKAEDNDFESLDLDAKKMACSYGRAIYKTYAESDPKFKFCIDVIDVYDFYIDPLGGGNVEAARYLGQDNIFKSKSDLLKCADDGYYDKREVARLVANLAPNQTIDNDNMEQEKANRLSALGLSPKMYNFAGEACDKLIESGTVFNGERYHVIWSADKSTILRAVPWNTDFESGLWCWTSWATHRDKFNFWSKSPAEDIVPVAEVIRVLANQEIDNRNKRNYGQRAYDPELFPNGAELEYRPNGLVAVKAGSSKVQAINSGIYEFQTPELNGTINLVNWLDNFTGQKTGITAATQGNSEDAKVGIYQGNLQQVADRIGLYNKSYTKCHAAIGRRFIWGVYEHLTEKQAVKFIGENGVNWDYLKGDEVDPDVDIKVESSSSELQLSELRKKQKTQALASIQGDPELKKATNAKWLLEQILLNGEFTDEDVRIAQDTENDGSREVMARAAEAIEEILEGDQPPLFRGATTGFQQKILDYALMNTDEDMKLYLRLTEYASAHDKIVMENMSRAAMKARNKAGLPLPKEAPQPQGMDMMGMPGSPDMAAQSPAAMPPMEAPQPMMS